MTTSRAASDPTLVLIADDHPVVRAGLRAQLAGAEFAVVAEVADGAAAIEAALRLTPHVVLIELELPVIDGLTATRVIRRARPSIAVILLTTYPSQSFAARAHAAGAVGCLLKDAGRDALSRMLRGVRCSS